MQKVKFRCALNKALIFSTIKNPLSITSLNFVNPDLSSSFSRCLTVFESCILIGSLR